MSCGGEKECDKLRLVSLPYAGADPWAVMIMYLDADLTIRAVEGARRSDQLAGVTIRKLVLMFGTLQILRRTINIET